MAAAAETLPPFGTVLVARTPQESPSPLELQMRNASARLRVVQKLSGGAQLLLPGSDTTIAIRAYFPKDLANIKGDDGLVAFRNAFKYPICFFVLPPGIAQQEHLSNPTSFVSLAQLIMSNRDGTTGQQKEGSGRVFLVPDVASAISILSSLVQTLTPARRDLKKRFHDSVKTKNFIGEAATPKVAAVHTANAFREFANRFELPVGEDDLLISRLGSISKIGSADLSSQPVYESTKDTLAQFFGGSCYQQLPSVAEGANLQTQNEIHDSSMGMMQESYGGQDLYGTVGGAGSFLQQQSSSAYQSPLRDSVEERLGYSQPFQGPPVDNTMRATPQLVNQQFVPRQQQGIPPMATRGQYERPRRLLYQSNARQMGNPIRPMSAYSSVSGS